MLRIRLCRGFRHCVRYFGTCLIFTGYGYDWFRLSGEGRGSDTMSGKLGRVRILILALSGMIGVLAVRGLTGFISGSGDSASAIAGVLSPLLVVLSVVLSGMVGDSQTSGYRTSATADALAPSPIGIILLVLAGFSWVRSVSLLPVLELDESIL